MIEDTHVGNLRVFFLYEHKNIDSLSQDGSVRSIKGRTSLKFLEGGVNNLNNTALINIYSEDNKEPKDRSILKKNPKFNESRKLEDKDDSNGNLGSKSRDQNRTPVFDLEPLNDKAKDSKFNPNGTATSGFNPNGTGTSSFNPNGTGTISFNPNDTGTGSPGQKLGKFIVLNEK